MSFQAAIDKRTVGCDTTPTTEPVSHQKSASLDVSNLKPSGGESYCSNCEALKTKMKNVLDALVGA